MRCFTCGERIAEGERHCPTCGSVAGRRERGEVVSVRRCPRCEYRGEGIEYFRRPGHLALLVVAGLFTYGLGALVYWLARRTHRICPRCGLGWEHAGRRRMGSKGGEERGDSRDSLPGGDALPSDGGKRRILGVVTILVAAIVISVGLVEMELVAAAVGTVLGVGGSLSYWWGWRAREERREAVLARLQREVLHLAGRKGGSLTVTEVAADLELSLEAAERVLISMDDGFRVRSEITRDGLLLYEFPEIQHRVEEARGSGGSDEG